MEKRCFGCMQIKSGTVCQHCGWVEGTQNKTHQLPVGTLLRGQYRIGRVLGQGGFGITYLGYDENLEIPVAIKEYFPMGMVTRDTSITDAVTIIDNSATYHNSLDRFLREARILAKLNDNPKVVQVYNFFAENGVAYIVMEHLQGRDLREYLMELGRPMTPVETLNMLQPVMIALNQVHNAGLIHRDLSPDNIMLLKEGGIKLLDFGTARDIQSGSHSAELILKHGFAPPEQYLIKGDVGPWSDVYSLCATAYYCMTGKVPPAASDRAMGGAVLDFSSIPGLTKAQTTALSKGMAIRKEERYLSVAELMMELYRQPLKQTKEKKAPVSNKKRIARNRKMVWLPFALISIALVSVFIMTRFAQGTEDEWDTEQTDAPISHSEEPTEETGEESISESTGPTPQEDMYCQAEALLAGGDKAHAAMLFGSLGDFYDARQRSFDLWEDVARRITLADAFYTHGIRADGTVEGPVSEAAFGWTEIVEIAAGGDDQTTNWKWPIFGLRSDGVVMVDDPDKAPGCDLSGWTDIVSISCGDSHLVGLRPDGTVVTTGNWEPYANGVSEWTDIVAVAAGPNHTIGLRADGTVIAVGYNDKGQCDGVKLWSDIVAISAGDCFSIGLRSDGGVVYAGSNEYGEGDVSNWADVVAISAGTRHVLGLCSDGTAMAAGFNFKGSCSVQWVENIAVVFAGRKYTVCIRKDGSAIELGYSQAARVNNWRDMWVPESPD